MISLNKLNEKGFTLIEVLVSLGILAFVMSAAFQIFSSNAQLVIKMEQNTMANFVAESVLVNSFVSEDELDFLSGSSMQGGREYQWERTINFLEDGKSAQILITIKDEEDLPIYNLIGFKVL